MRKKPTLLFGVNGMGLGHLTHAYCLYPTLKKYYNVDILVSGLQHENPFDFPIKYKVNGLRFVYKNGHVCWLSTLKKTTPLALIKDMKTLDLSPYDLVLTDFEPISAWAAFFQKKYCIHMSHQASLFYTSTPKPNWLSTPIWTQLMKLMAPSCKKIGFHFKHYTPAIYGPLIKPDLQPKDITNGDHILVYLSAYSAEEQVTFFKQFPNNTFQIFHNQFTHKKTINNLTCNPINHTQFKTQMLSCKGFISQAGFDSIAEVLYLNKPLVVLPIKKQFEQFCNAEALKDLGVLVLKKLQKPAIQDWLIQHPIPHTIHPVTPDELCAAIDTAFKTHNQIS
ncbi:MAG: glycosyltransferase family protein [bacterium]